MTVLPSTFREALMATARVTAIAVASCNRSAVPVTDTPAAPLGDGGALASAVPPPTRPNPPPEGCPPGDDRFACCNKLLRRSVSAKGELLKKDEETIACCHEVLGQVEKKTSDWSKLEEGVRWGCCDAKEVHTKHGMACTPWGPPMPPPIVWLDDTMTSRSFEWRGVRCVDTINT